MNKYLKSTVAIGAISFITTPANADWYFSLFGGVNLADEETIFSTVGSISLPTYSLYASGTIDLSLDLDTGFVIGAAAGWDFENNFSLEAEIAYRGNDGALNLSLEGSGTYGTTFFSGTTSIDLVDGEVNVISVMANAWYEFETDSNWVPYLGAGIGWAKVKLESSLGDTDDSRFAYQLGIGLGYEMNETSRFGLEYRYFGAPEAEFFDFALVEYDYSAHSIVVSFKF